MKVTQWLRRGRSTRSELEQRVSDLEADMAEMRRHHLRVAEVVDVVEELLVPLATRDETRVEEAVETFRRSL